MISILLSEILPALMIIYLIYKIDDFQEPFSHVLIAFGLGILSPLITLFISSKLNMGLSSDSSPWTYALTMAAIPEELGRFLILWWVTKHWDEVAEPFDCILYGAAIWGGFSAIENLIYAGDAVIDSQNPFVILSIRATLCTLGHISWGVIMGAYVGIARFANDQTTNWALRGLLITIGLHMGYDALLMTTSSGVYQITNLIGALSIDAFSLVVAMLFIGRMEEIQDISMYEGHKVRVQAELLKRHRPTHNYGIIDIFQHFGFSGLFYILCALASTSLMIFWINALFVTGNRHHIMSCVMYLLGALYFWGKTFGKVSSVHEASEKYLDQDLAHAIQGKALPEREIDHVD